MIHTKHSVISEEKSQKPVTTKQRPNKYEHIISLHCPEDKTKQRFHVEITGITYPFPNYQVTRTNSAIYTFEYICEGSGTIEADGHRYHPSKGDVYILHAGEDHHYYSDPHWPWHKIWFNIRGSLVDHLIKSYEIQGLHLISDLNIHPLFENFLKVCENIDLNYYEKMDKCSLLFHQLLQEIHLNANQNMGTPETPAEQLRYFLETNTHRNITVSDMSQHLALSESQLNRLFKRTYNTTPYKYLLNLRMEESLTLLTNTNLTIKAIAHRLQFADEHYFSNFFKKTYGQSPSSYRK